MASSSAPAGAGASAFSQQDQLQVVELLAPANLAEARKQRLQQFLETLRAKLGAQGSQPRYVVAVPGRVNLIGDHIDYHGFPVLPMAIGRCVWVAVWVGAPATAAAAASGVGPHADHKFAIVNANAQQYPTWRAARHSLAHGARLAEAHRWHNYLLCGYHGMLANRLLGVPAAQVLEHARQVAAAAPDEHDERLGRLANLAMFVDSDLPPAAGLSSSSALVCASALATWLLLKHSPANDEPTNLQPPEECRANEMAELCAKFELLIGTQGGGMDQAVIMAAQAGYAKHINFVPSIRCDNVHLPANTCWLISHCGVEYPKAQQSAFNVRVLETKLGAALIAKASQADDINADASITLGLIKERLFPHWLAKDIVEHIRNNVFGEEDEFTVEQVCQRLQLTRDQLIQRFNTSQDFLTDRLTDEKLVIRSRCEHVFEEADRVQRFKSICDTTTDISLLGQLMTQSHHSLRDKYDCSHPALDRLVGVALDAGALGSRLTGAGWGGCIVSLVEETKCQQVSRRLNEVSKFTFRSEPQPGCQIIQLFSTETQDTNQ